jgi:predicted ribosome quality control (RQC) complex YloA/Tae2 family protein
MVKFDNTFENNQIKIGKNAKENDDIINASNQSDIWFHLKSFPSCHVVICCSPEFPIDNIMIMHCAHLTKQNTKYRNLPNLKINYTQIKNIQTTEKPGLVVIKGKPNTITI